MTATTAPAEIFRVVANDGAVHLAHPTHAVLYNKAFPACKTVGSSPINATYTAADAGADLTCVQCAQRQAISERRAAARGL